MQLGVADIKFISLFELSSELMVLPTIARTNCWLFVFRKLVSAVKLLNEYHEQSNGLR